MEQFEVVFKPVEGYEHVVIKGENGELIVRLVPKSSVIFEDKHPYFTKITAEDRDKVKNWLAKQKGETVRVKRFLGRVKEAVQAVNYDFWIANLEPSVANWKVYYAKGEDVGVGFSCNQYKKMAEEYATERGSRLANLHELFIWYALRIVTGFWTLDYVCNDSSSAGNYRNAPNAYRRLETTGARTCGGYGDGQGNTFKIVTVGDDFALVGGFYFNIGDYCPVADVYYYNIPDNFRDYSSGVLVLTK